MRRLSLTSSAALVAAGTAVTYGIALMARILVGSWFGDSVELDLFFLLYSLAEWVPLLLGLAFERTLVPLLHRKEQEEGPGAMRRTAGAHFLFVGLLGAVVSAWAVTFPESLAAWIPLPPVQARPATAATLLVWLVPAAVLPLATAVLRSYLFARNRYAAPTAASLVGRGAYLLALVLLLPSHGAVALAIAVFAGNGINLLGIAYLALRERLFPEPGWLTGLPGALRGNLRGLGLVGLTALVGRSDLMIDRVVASHLPAGALTCLVFALALAKPPRMIVESACSVSFGEASRLLAAGKLDRVRRLLDLQVRLVIAIGIPAAAAGALLAHPVVDDLFGRGSFDATAVDLTATILAAYSAIFLTGLLSRTFAAALYAGRRHLTILALAGAGAGANLLLDIVLARWLGAPGIALATVAVTTVGCLLAGPIVVRMVGGADLAGWARCAGRALLLTCVTVPAARLCAEALEAGGITGIPRTLLAVTLLGLAHAGLALLRRDPEALFLLDKFRHRLPAVTPAPGKELS